MPLLKENNSNHHHYQRSVQTVTPRPPFKKMISIYIIPTHQSVNITNISKH